MVEHQLPKLMMDLITRKRTHKLVIAHGKPVRIAANSDVPKGVERFVEPGYLVSPRSHKQEDPPYAGLLVCMASPGGFEPPLPP